MNEPDPFHAQKFLNDLFIGVEEDHYALLWSLRDADHKSSHWFPSGDPTKMAEQAIILGGDREAGQNVYVAVSVAATPPPPHEAARKRISNENSAGIMGLWADIDIRDPDAHAKYNLPPDEAAAEELLASLGMPASLVVHSGHGLQAWWLFNEFWRFDSENDRHAAASLAERWNATLRVRATERSWTVDSIFDLARVMRVPGTWNRKYEPVVPVVLKRATGLTYSPDDLDAMCVGEEYLVGRGLSSARTYLTGELVLNPNAEPPFEKMDILRSNHDKFADTWDRKRGLREFPDQSASSYDFALAIQAASYDWTDQEIADLIIAWRRKHRDHPEKAIRSGYIANTISKARDTLTREEVSESVAEVSEALREAEEAADPDGIRDTLRQALDVISAQLGLEVIRIIRYTSEPPSFRLVTPTQSVDLGDVNGILMWPKLKASIFGAMRVQIPRFTIPNWDALTALIAQAWTDQDIGEETTERGEIRAWLSGYLQQHPPVPFSNEAVLREEPYIDKIGRTVIFLGAFESYLWLSFQEKPNNRKHGKMLSHLECMRDKAHYTPPGGVDNTKSIWILPEGWQK